MIRAAELCLVRRSGGIGGIASRFAIDGIGMILCSASNPAITVLIQRSVAGCPHCPFHFNPDSEVESDYIPETNETL